MSSLATVTLSSCLVAISSRIGATMRHGPHHSAQKSTMTGFSDCRTSVSKLASVTFTVAMVTFLGWNFGWGWVGTLWTFGSSRGKTAVAASGVDRLVDGDRRHVDPGVRGDV